ncbi:MAG TPA: hypothetical protein VHH36_06705, partial [Candidatus Thermoplasmatota archaeon]|nr:hypothetical protein [Candidatus Thermoplasmatota archaeon]
MRIALVCAAIAALFPLATPAAAHFPPGPTTGCNDGTDGAGDALDHDFTAAGSATATIGVAGERGRGAAIL